MNLRSLFLIFAISFSSLCVNAQAISAWINDSTYIESSVVFISTSLKTCFAWEYKENGLVKYYQPIFYKRKGRKIKPDKVLLIKYINEILVNSETVKYLI